MVPMLKVGTAWKLHPRLARARISSMVLITFKDRKTQRRALAFLLSRFAGRVFKNGEHLVPEAALEALAEQNIPFIVKRKADSE
jgi:hypothetical protein